MKYYLLIAGNRFDSGKPVILTADRKIAEKYINLYDGYYNKAEIIEIEEDYIDPVALKLESENKYPYMVQLDIIQNSLNRDDFIQYILYKSNTARIGLCEVKSTKSAEYSIISNGVYLVRYLLYVFAENASDALSNALNLIKEENISFVKNDNIHA